MKKASKPQTSPVTTHHPRNIKITSKGNRTILMLLKGCQRIEGKEEDVDVDFVVEKEIGNTPTTETLNFLLLPHLADNFSL